MGLFDYDLNEWKKQVVGRTDLALVELKQGNYDSAKELLKEAERQVFNIRVDNAIRDNEKGKLEILKKIEGQKIDPEYAEKVFDLEQKKERVQREVDSTTEKFRETICSYLEQEVPPHLRGPSPMEGIEVEMNKYKEVTIENIDKELREYGFEPEDW